MAQVFDSISDQNYHEFMAREISITEFFQEVNRKVRRIFVLRQQTPIGNRYDLTDVIQNLNVQICNDLNENETVSRFLETAWLRKVTLGHFCKLQRYNLAKKRSILKEKPVDVARISSTHSVQEEVEKTELANLMLDCLDQLEPDVQQVLKRRCYDDIPFSQIAIEMEVSKYTVKKMYHDGTKMLESMMTGEARIK